VERTRILVHLVDAAAIDPEHPLHAYETINAELSCYSPALTDKPRIVALNKMDLSEAKAAADVFSETVGSVPVFRISAVTGAGVDRLLKFIVSELDSMEVAK
jgi:GTP-binding protein